MLLFTGILNILKSETCFIKTQLISLHSRLMMKLPNDTEINANAEFIWRIMNFFIRKYISYIMNESRKT